MALALVALARQVPRSPLGWQSLRAPAGLLVSALGEPGQQPCEGLEPQPQGRKYWPINPKVNVGSSSPRGTGSLLFHQRLLLTRTS